MTHNAAVGGTTVFCAIHQKNHRATRALHLGLFDQKRERMKPYESEPTVQAQAPRQVCSFLQHLVDPPSYLTYA